MIENTIQVEGGLGDASPSQVMAGATFTSETGFKQSGTFEPIAKNIGYDNTSSGLQAETTQDAIDEHIANTKAELADTVPYNLIHFPYYENTHVEDGITWTVDDDGVITAKGTATDRSQFMVRTTSENCKPLKVGKSYHVSGCPDGGSGSTYRIMFITFNRDSNGNIVVVDSAGISNSSGGILNITQEYTGIWVYIDIFSGYTATDLQFKPMIVEGTAQRDYHRGFNSTYELSKNLEVAYEDTFPQNLIQFPYFEGSHTDNGIEWVVNEDGIVMANGNATGDSEFTVRRRLSDNTPFVLPAGTYTVSGCPVNGRDATYVLSVIKTSESTGGAELITREYGSGATFTLEKETIIGVNFYIKKGQTVNNLTLKPMLVKGSETKPYHRGFKSVYELDKSVHEMKKSVVDHLLSTSQDLPLSANQGRMLNEKVDSVNEKLADCWISFTDADGNPTTEPYIHWNEEE